MFNSTHSWSRSPVALVRVALTERAALREGERDNLVFALKSLDQYEDDWARGAEQLRDNLYGAVPTLDRGARRIVLDWKRAADDPSRVLRLADPAGVVPQHIREELVEWQRRAAELLDRVSAFQGEVHATVADTRSDLLAQLSPTSVLARGIALGSPHLAEAVFDKGGLKESALDDPSVFESTLSYWARSVTKPSPFSTFTATGGVLFSGERERLGEDRRIVSVITPARQLVEAIVARAGLDDWVEVEPIVMVRRGDVLTSFSQQVLSGAWVGYGTPVCESLVPLSVTPEIQRVIKACETSPTLSHLMADLSGSGGAISVSVQRYVQSLLQLGVLSSRPPVPDPQPSMGLAVLEKAKEGPHPGLADVASSLLEESEAFPELDAPSRGSSVRRVREACGRAGLPLPAGSGAPLFEDCVWRPPWQLDERAFVAYERDLSDLLRLSATFDFLYWKRYRLGQWMMNSRIDRVPVLDFYQTYHHRPWETQDLGWSEKAQEIAQRRLRSLETHCHSVAGEFRLDGPALVRDADDLCPSDSTCRSGVVFCQAADCGLVVNSVGQGWGRYTSRFLHLLGLDKSDEGDWRNFIASKASQGGEVVADLGIAVGTTANVHDPVLPNYVDYPGLHQRGWGQPILLKDVLVQVDQDTGLAFLYWQARGCRLRPVHLGFLAERWMPGLARFLLHFQPARAQNYPWPVLAGGTEQVVLRTPRIRLGEVILARSAWHFSPPALPDLTNSPLAERYRKVQAWVEKYELPQVGMIRVDMFGASRRPDPGNDPRSFKRKPQFVNLADPSWLRRFARLVASTEQRLSYEELSPGLDDQVSTPLVDDRTTEFVIEFYR